MRRQNEQLICALCHLFNCVPLWGMVFNGVVWFANRESSRAAQIHARQAMFFHGMLLASVMVWMIVVLISRLFAVVIPPLGGLLNFLNTIVIAVLLAAHILTCLWGTWRCWTGQPFRYPLVGEFAE